MDEGARSEEASPVDESGAAADGQLRRRLAEVEAELAETRDELEATRTRLRRLQSQYQTTVGTAGFKVLRKVRGGLGRIFPRGTRRGRLYRRARAGGPQALRSIAAGPRRWIRRRRFQPPKFQKKVEPFALPQVARPRISIVIPVHGKSIYTYNCLRSLTTSDTSDFEAIVVDDFSTDDTAQVLASIENVKVVTNSENLGFTGSCNAGAAVASGEHLVFLNNDVMVTPQALSALIDSLEEIPGAGLVGAKLLYPNGMLQEAGGVVFSDGSALNYGKFDDPDLPRYSFVRDVDYCSGACIAIRRDLFEKVGTFDMRYSPAYYEDTDLGMAVRKMGYRVLYQPRAEVIHFEGISHGTDLSTGIKRYQDINHAKFVEKWTEELRDHLPPGSDLYEAADRRRGPRVLVADHHVPTYDRDSGSLRLWRLLEFLEEFGYVIAFIPKDGQALQPYTQQMQDRGIEVVHRPRDVPKVVRRLAPLLQAAILSRPGVVGAYGPLLSRMAPQSKLFYDTVDLHFLRLERMAEVEGDESIRSEAESMKETELRLASSCDATIVVSSVEKEILEKELPGIRVHLIPNIHETVAEVAGPSERKDLLFVGHFDHPANRDAVRYFVRDVFPRVRESLPKVVFHIVGSDPQRAIGDLASDDVDVAGWVPDLAPYLSGSRVFVAPLRFGAGLKGKVGESLAWGLPAVTTSIGAEGSGLTDGIDILIGDDPGSFASHVVDLYTDEELWSRLSKTGREFIQSRFSPEVVREAVAEMLQVPSAQRNSA